MKIGLISLNKTAAIIIAMLTFLASMFFIMPKAQAAPQKTLQTDFIIEGLPTSLTVPKITLTLWNSSVSITENSLALSQEISPEDLVSQTLGLTNPKPIKTRKTYSFNPTEIYNYLSENTLGFEQTKNAKLVIENNHATTFEPGQNGLHIDLATSTKNVIVALESKKSEAKIAMRAKEPAKPLAGTNTLGIN
mgnify:CR=1 FL=1